LEVGAAFCARVVPVAFLAALAALRWLYPRTVHDLPLSRPPERLLARGDQAASLWVIAFGLAFAAAGCSASWKLAAALGGALLAREVGAGRAARRADAGAAAGALGPAH